MRLSLKSGLVALVALAAATGGAQALDLKAGGAGKLTVTKAQLGIIPPSTGICPAGAKLTAWVFTNKPGTVQIMLVRGDGQVTGPYPVTTVAGSGGVVVGSYKTKKKIIKPIDTQYRVVVAGSDVGSNWVPLTYGC